VRKAVKKIISTGNGLISGGALGVDYFALDEAMRLDLTCRQIKIFLPAKLDIFTKHFFKRVDEEIISHEQAKDLITQLKALKQTNPKALIENKKTKGLNKRSYFLRNSAMVNAADKLIAFHVNKSEGTQDAINKAGKKGIPIKIFSYSL